MQPFLLRLSLRRVNYQSARLFASLSFRIHLFAIYSLFFFYNPPVAQILIKTYGFCGFVACGALNQYSKSEIKVIVNFV